jgi:hypothetical protein
MGRAPDAAVTSRTTAWIEGNRMEASSSVRIAGAEPERPAVSETHDEHWTIVSTLERPR